MLCAAVYNKGVHSLRTLNSSVLSSITEQKELYFSGYNKLLNGNLVSNGTPGNASRAFATSSLRDHFAEEGLVSEVTIDGGGGECTELRKRPSCNRALLQFPVTFTIKTIRDIAPSHSDDGKNEALCRYQSTRCPHIRIETSRYGIL